MKNNGKLEFCGTGVNMGSSNLTELEKTQVINSYNEATKKAEKIMEDKINRDLEESRKIKEDSVNLEIKPTSTYVLCTIYDKNPWNQIIETNSGLIIPTSTGEFKSTKTGETEVADTTIKFGHVLDVGPEVKFIKAGDDIIFRNHTQLPAPFLGQSFWVVGQGNVITVIGENLSERN